MEEKNKVAPKDVRTMIVSTWVSAIFGGIILIMAIVVIIQGIRLSDCELARVEILNRNFAGEYKLYPSEGIDYELEARVIDGDTKGDWHHDLIAAEYGDTIEIRLKAVAADATDIDLDAIRHHVAFTCSAGLELLEAAIDHDQVILPDGSLADYLDDADDEHIAYIAVGTFKFTSKDWWSGKGASAIIPCNADMFTKLEVIAPYCGVDIVVVIAFLVAAVLFGIVIPLVFKREANCILEDSEETEDTE